jgi:hypothetical protein
MTRSDLKELVENVPVLGTPTSTGSISGLYQIYSKYNDENIWGFTQSYRTKEGISNMLLNVNDDLLKHLDIKLVFTNAQDNSTTELFNTMEI